MQPVFKYFKTFAGTIDKIFACKSKGLSEEGITTPAISDNNLAPKHTFITHDAKTTVKFAKNCLKQDKVSFGLINVVNIFTVYELEAWSCDLNPHFTLKNCFF